MTNSSLASFSHRNRSLQRRSKQNKNTQKKYGASTKKCIETNQSSKKYKFSRAFGLVVILVGVSIGTWYAIDNNRINSSVDTLIGAASAEPSNNNNNNSNYPPDSDSGSVFVPSTNKPSMWDVLSYTTAANRPKRIEINNIDVFARVKEVENNKKGEVGVPENVYDAAWYNYSSELGVSPGSSVIVGHVGFRSIEGVFSRIDKLQKGDEITIVMGDERELVYKVTDNKSIELNDFSMSSFMSYNNQNNSRLHLITCSGSILRGSTTYDSRLVVSAELQ